MDIKGFKKNVKQSCHFMAPLAGRKECIETMMCNWNNCQKEMQDKEAERKTCENEKDFSKQVDCRVKLFQKSDKIAALAHCEANKCPQIRDYIRKQGKEMAKRMTKNMKHTKDVEERKKCIESHCGKETKNQKEQMDKLDETVFECQKKYAIRKEQDNCSKQATKNYKKAETHKNNCIDKYCKPKPSKPSNNKNIRKTRKTSKKTNKKTKKN